MTGEIRRLLAGRPLGAPDPEQIVIELEREAKIPAKGPIAGDDLVVVGRQHGAGLDRGRDERCRLPADHVEVELDRHRVIVLGRPDVEVLPFAEPEAGLVVEPDQA